MSTTDRTSIICTNRKPMLPASLVYIQFTQADAGNTCVYCTGIYRSCDIFACRMCTSLYCTDCINTFSEKGKYPRWFHSVQLCDEYCSFVPKDTHRYHLLCSSDCADKFYKKYKSHQSFDEIYRVDGDPTGILEFFTEPNSFIFSKTPDDIETYFNRLKTPQPCYTSALYLQSMFNQDHHLTHIHETHYLCLDCCQMYASSYMLKCDTCSTLYCSNCVILRYIFLESKFMHDLEWCAACDTIRNMQISECNDSVHALYFLCKPECLSTFQDTHDHLDQQVMT